MNLTDQQILTVVIAILLPLCALIYSNSRISDVKEVLRAEIKLEIGSLRSDMTLQFEKLSNKMADNQKELLSEIRAHETQHHPRESDIKMFSYDAAVLDRVG